MITMKDLPQVVVDAISRIRTAGHDPDIPEHIENEHCNHYFLGCKGCGLLISILPDGTISDQEQIDKPCNGAEIRNAMRDMWNSNPGSLQERG